MAVVSILVPSPKTTWPMYGSTDPIRRCPRHQRPEDASPILTPAGTVREPRHSLSLSEPQFICKMGIRIETPLGELS